jgi:ketosteroid isomerase-like protein
MSPLRTCILLVVGFATAVAAQTPAVRVPKTAPAPTLVPTGNPAPTAAEAAKIAEVLAFEKAMEAAVVRGDAKALDRMLAPDFIFTHGDGWTTGGAPLKVDTKASWLAYVVKQPPPYLYRELDHVQVELHGDIAITVGRYLYLPQSNSPQLGHLYVWFERVYQKQNGEWKHLSHKTVKGPVREDDRFKEVQ